MYSKNVKEAMKEGKLYYIGEINRIIHIHQINDDHFICGMPCVFPGDSITNVVRYKVPIEFLKRSDVIKLDNHEKIAGVLCPTNIGFFATENATNPNSELASISFSKKHFTFVECVPLPNCFDEYHTYELL